MDHWKKFKSLKQRGEWVELRFMACAAERGFYVLKPWGEMRPYDVGIEYDQNFLRVQVKSTTFRAGTGYLLHFKPNDRIRTYAVDDFDLLRRSRRRVVHHPLCSRPRRCTHHRLYASPRRAAQKRSLLLRSLQRSLAPPLQKPPSAGRARATAPEGRHILA